MDAELFYYFTLGEERWKSTNVWPVPGTQMMRWYLDAGNTLSKNQPVAPSGADSYAINFDATTGEKNRWHTQVGGQVFYPDRASEDQKLLAYTSAPLDSDVEVTGYAVIDLFVTSTANDGAFFVYLEDIDERSRDISNRRVAGAAPKMAGKASLQLFVPYHSFKQKDAPLGAVKSAELKFGFQQPGADKEGHRVQLQSPAQIRTASWIPAGRQRSRWPQ